MVDPSKKDTQVSLDVTNLADKSMSRKFGGSIDSVFHMFILVQGAFPLALSKRHSNQ